MINCFRTLPQKVGIAFSGGVDSAVMLHLAVSLGREVTLYTFDHKSETSNRELDFAYVTSRRYNLELVTGEIKVAEIPCRDSKERYWSAERNTWLNSFDTTICTGHHLDDAAEWYLMTSLQGGNGGYLMNYQVDNIIRPLLLSTKNSLVEYAEDHWLTYITDPTNADRNFNLRNKVRLELLPKVLEIFPGYMNTVKRKIIVKENTI
jgi:tRNA(Ile)-lysidine synthase